MNLRKWVIAIFLTAFFAPLKAKPQHADSVKLFQIVRLGLRYHVQEFTTLNQRIASACNCDESLSLNNRSMQGLSLSVFEPLSTNWAFGADFGFALGKRMNDAKSYSRQSALTVSMDGFYHLFDGDSKVRPYITAGFRYDLQSSHIFAMPFGAGLRFKGNSGYSFSLQTAYDSGRSKLVAQNMLTSFGFHLPLFIRENGAYVNASTAHGELLKRKSSLYPKNMVVKQVKTKSYLQQPTEKLPPLLAASKEQLSRIIYFRKGRINLNNAESVASLADIMYFLSQDSSRIAKLIGFKPHPRFKVKVIYRYLVKQGVPANRLEVAYYRKRLQGAKSKIRRVEILVE